MLRLAAEKHVFLAPGWQLTSLFDLCLRHPQFWQRMLEMEHSTVEE